MPEQKRIGGLALLDQLPTDRLVDQCQQLIGLLAEQAIAKAFDSVDELTDRLLDYANNGGPGLITAITGGGARAEGESSEDKQPLRETMKSGVTRVSESVRQAFSGVSSPSRSGQAAQPMNIAEQIDVGVPVRLAYDQWTRFQDFSQFIKMVGVVENASAGSTNGKVRIHCSYPDWDTTIIEQVPDERIVWRSRGARGRVDGAVSFHAMAPNMTRILLAIEYYPQGLLERAGKLWHAQDRRVRLEIRQFQCHVMTRALLDLDSPQGWRGEIHNGAVVHTHAEPTGDDARERQETGENQERSQVPDEPAKENLDAAEESHTYEDNADDSAEETDEYDDVDDTYVDADDTYDDADEEYDDEPEHTYVPSRRR